MSTTTTPATHMEAFAFGDPVPVLDQRDLMGYFHSAFNGRYYEPPVSFDGLAKALTANPHHESAIRYKCNLLASFFNPHPWLSRMDFKRLVMDYLVFGNFWVEEVVSQMGTVMRLKPTLARWTRMDKDGNARMLVDGAEHAFASGSVLHVMDPDPSQEIYGLPGYISAMQSAFLNEEATLFRRKYYINGSHAGFILYLTDAANNPKDIDDLRKALKESKGPGNFRNLFMYAPNGKKDGIQLIPISEVTAKDEFLNIKTVTRDDVLAVHRVPPQLLGTIPQNAGGFGSVESASKIFITNEIIPIMSVFTAINDRWGQEVVTYRDPTLIP